jgi:hypothetical protein
VAALPEALVRRAVRYRLGRPGFRTRELTRVTTRLEAAVDRVAALAARYRRRWQVATSLAPLKPPRPMEVLPWTPVPGSLKELTVFAIGSHLVRMVMWPSAARQPVGVERISVLAALRGLSAPRTGLP